MNLLLDSCTLIWLASEPGRLSAAATAAINDPASVLHVSHASLWEIALKHGAGKLALPDTPRRWWGEQVQRWGRWNFTFQRKRCSGAVNCRHITRIRLIA